MNLKQRLLQPRYLRILAGVAVGGAIAASLFMFDRHRDSASPSQSTSTSGAQPSSGNPTADRVHELTALEQELKQKPEHPPILLRMAQISSELGKPADAISYLQRLLKADPGNVDGRLELSRLLFENNDVEGALRETSKILETNSKQVDALYNQGAIYANLSNTAMARTYWNRAVAADPASDSGKRAREGLEKIAGQNTLSSNAAAPNANGWHHPAVH